MKKRSLSHFVYYAANRAVPVFLLLLLLLGLSACASTVCRTSNDYTSWFGDSKDKVFAALDENKLTYKEDDLYANAYVLDQTETLENHEFSVYLLFDFDTDTLYGCRKLLFVENPTDEDCKLPEKLLDTLTTQYGEPTTYPGLENRLSTHLDRLSADAIGSGEVYNEYWSISENYDASVGVNFLPDGRLFVDVVWQVPQQAPQT